MDRSPSDEEIRQAVGKYVARRGITVHPTETNTNVHRNPLLKFEIVRSVKDTREGSRKVPGSGKDIAKRGTYTDLETYPVDPPADPREYKRVDLVREGSFEVVDCEDCTGGTYLCTECDGRGKHDCAPYVDCPVCDRSTNVCWECEGRGRPRTRRRTPPRPRPAGAPERATCKRCGVEDVACPKCEGEGQLECPDCEKQGFVTCESCNGKGRHTHAECRGTGRFALWTEGVVEFTPVPDGANVPAPAGLRRQTDRLGRWRPVTLTRATDKLPDDLDPAHRRLVEPRLALGEREFGRSATLRHLPFCHVTMVADPHRVYYAFPSNSGIEVVARPTKERVRHYAAITVAALAVVALVATLVLAALN
ncbi:hypothetical protein OK074_0683 [Actinobacteria bacterium OK074]|nr:hypothetical protein OK074_0683 [Actinobacteria bacterium OK074]